MYQIRKILSAVVELCIDLKLRWTDSQVRGAPGLVDRVFAVHAGSRGFDSQQRHMSERFFPRSIRPGYPHPVWSELVKRVSEWRSVIACSVTDHRRWCSPYQTGRTVHVHTKHNAHWGNVPDMVSYPGTVASLNKHNWNKQTNRQSDKETTVRKKSMAFLFRGMKGGCLAGYEVGVTRRGSGSRYADIRCFFCTWKVIILSFMNEKMLGILSPNSIKLSAYLTLWLITILTLSHYTLKCPVIW